MIIINIIIGIAGIVIGFLIIFLILRAKKKNVFGIIDEAKKEAACLRKESKNEIALEKKAEIIEARDEWYKTKRIQEGELKDRKKELHIMEKKFTL
jgi:hypothetical protein